MLKTPVTGMLFFMQDGPFITEHSPVFQVLAGAAIKDRQGNVLFKKGDTVVDVLTTAGEGASAATGELWPGLYEIVELTPPKCYHPSEKHIFVDTVSAAGQSEEAVVEYEGLKTNAIRLGAQAIVKILGDDHDAPAPLCNPLCQSFASGVVQMVRRLVQNQERCIAGKCQRQIKLLPLPFRHLSERLFAKLVEILAQLGKALRKRALAYSHC